MRDRPAVDHELVTRPPVGAAPIVLLTAVIPASGRLTAVVVAWVS